MRPAHFKNGFACIIKLFVFKLNDKSLLKKISHKNDLLHFKNQSDATQCNIVV